MRAPVAVSLLSLLIGTALTACGQPGSAPPTAAVPGNAAPESAAPASPSTAPLSIVGLVDGTSLVNFSTTDTTLADTREITGLRGDTTLVGIDFRVQDGKLYGVGDKGGVYTLDDTGAAAKVKQLSVALDGDAFGVDFNPAANALRVISDTGQNLRQPFADAAAPTAKDGALTNPAVAPATGTVPAVGATATGYTNNDAEQATATALFVLDTKVDRVSLQSPANAGSFAPVGGLGVDADTKAGFDIYTAAEGPTALATLKVGGSWGLYQINLFSGKAESMGDLDGNVGDIAIPLEQS